MFEALLVNGIILCTYTKFAYSSILPLINDFLKHISAFIFPFLFRCAYEPCRDTGVCVCSTLGVDQSSRILHRSVVWGILSVCCRVRNLLWQDPSYFGIYFWHAFLQNISMALVFLDANSETSTVNFVRQWTVDSGHPRDLFFPLLLKGVRLIWSHLKCNLILKKYLNI